MIEFFEFLNTCSSGRTVLYLIFIIIITFSVFAGVSDIIKRLGGGEKNNHHYYVNGEEQVGDEVDNENNNE
jgi:hypothetical protein